MNKSKILKEAGTQFFVNGIKAVTIEDICRAVGIAKKTFYLSFEDKNALVNEFVDACFAKIFRRVQQSSSVPDAIERLERFDSSMMEFLVTFYPRLISDLKKFHHPIFEACVNHRLQLVGCLVEIIEFGKRQGVFRKSLNSSILAELRFSEIEALCSLRHEKGLWTFDHTKYHLFDHYMAGLVLNHEHRLLPAHLFQQLRHD